MQVLLQGGPDAEENNGESQGLVLALGGGHEGGLQLAMKPFDHAVGLRVVAGILVAADTEKDYDFVSHVSLELAAAV